MSNDQIVTVVRYPCRDIMFDKRHAAYLVWSGPKGTIVEARASTRLAVLAGFLGALVMGAYLASLRFAGASSLSLTLSTAGFLIFLLAVALGTLGWPALRPHRFAILFLLFAIPLPEQVTDFLSRALQHASAEAADLTFRLTGMPLLRDGLSFQMPGLTIFVAEECSGIHSTLVLFITSVIASHLFLRSGWKKALFVLSVFPLGVFRNAFRITVISWLTVNVNRDIIDSPLHHRGGPIFFVLSLIPLFALLLWLRRSDSGTEKNRPHATTTSGAGPIPALPHTNP